MSNAWPHRGTHNNLTEAEAEMLALIAEEAGEIVQAVTKILRHGFDAKHPRDLDGSDNRERLMEELGDVAAAVQIAEDHGLVDSLTIRVAANDKRRRVGRYLHAVKVAP